MYQVSEGLILLKIYVLIIMIKHINNRVNRNIFAGIVDINPIIVMIHIIIAGIRTAVPK